MHALQRISPFRCFTVVVLALAWLMATNHCAVALVAERLETTANTAGAAGAACDSCSDDEGKGAKPPTEQAGMGCCKVFKSIVETAGVSVKSPLLPTTFDMVAMVQVLLRSVCPNNVANSAQGPPGWAGGFALAHLKQCHPALAPPSFS